MERLPGLAGSSFGESNVFEDDICFPLNAIL